MQRLIILSVLALCGCLSASGLRVYIYIYLYRIHIHIYIYRYTYYIHIYIHSLTPFLCFSLSASATEVLFLLPSWCLAVSLAVVTPIRN